MIEIKKPKNQELIDCPKNIEILAPNKIMLWQLIQIDFFSNEIFYKAENNKFLFFFFLVPPHQILVYDASGRDVAGAVGPLLEGDSLVVTCEVRGG